MAPFDAQLAGVQLCCAHPIRSRKVVLTRHSDQQTRAPRVIEVLREADQAVIAAKTAGADSVDAALLAGLPERYDKAVNGGS